jgi:hypothetical protein
MRSAANPIDPIFGRFLLQRKLHMGYSYSCRLACGRIKNIILYYYNLQKKKKRKGNRKFWE